jgi:AraC-like DNA-binding protein
VNQQAAMNTSGKNLVEVLKGSRLFTDFSRSFNSLTGLPLTLRPTESWQLPYHGRPNENGYCAIMASRSSACAFCLQTQQRLSECSEQATSSLTCPSGLTETAVPIRLGEQLVGFLQTGQMFDRAPSEAQFERVAKQVADWGLEVGRSDLKKAYFQTQVVRPRDHEALVNMLEIFSQHLALVSNRMVVQQAAPDPPMIARAKAFIEEHQAENLSLKQVAKAVNTSTFYFCKVFKKATGINFTDYVSRIRIEKAKNLALNPNLRISEIAFEVGFQSLTHFNRVFKKITGMSPSDYRAQLPVT